MVELVAFTWIGELSLFGLLVVILLTALGVDKRGRYRRSSKTH